MKAKELKVVPFVNERNIVVRESIAQAYINKCAKRKPKWKSVCLNVVGVPALIGALYIVGHVLAAIFPFMAL